jgi:hypothetical protein
MNARIAAIAALLLTESAASLGAHDLFIKLDAYFLAPGDTLHAPVLNGTFLKSENSIGWERVHAFATLGPAGLSHAAPRSWLTVGDTTRFEILLPRSGTYVVGFSTLPRQITLKAPDFNAYLKQEGITDILARRKKAGEMNAPATERYTKHAKAVLQVGNDRTVDVSAPLGFPAEIVPLDNPYVGQRTGAVRLQCLADGKPAPGLTVLIGNQRGHEIPRERALVTDTKGIVTVRLTRSGRWYAKFVRMVPARGGSDYESMWATITFEVR